MARLFRTVLCEGRDDIAALRAMLRHLNDDRAVEPTEQGFRVCREPVVVEVIDAQSKTKLAERAILIGTASQRPDRLVVCFDPDDTPDSRDFVFFLDGWRDLVGKRGSVLSSAGEGRWSCRLGNRDVLVMPAPWRAGVPAAFDGASTTDNDLERVLIGGILDHNGDENVLKWAQDSTDSLLRMLPDHGWKRSFRLWNAALEPKTESSSFVDKLLQSERTKDACLRALMTTPVAAALQWALAGA